MDTNTKEKTIAITRSVGADTAQSFVRNYNHILTDVGANINETDVRRDIRIKDRQTLNTVTMGELYEEVYNQNKPIIEGLLYPGTYLFAGAPKLGKSFLMLQFAYHVATGKALWGYSVRQGTVLYLALEDDRRRLQERLYGTEITEDLYLATESDSLEGNLLNQLQNFRTEHPDTTLVIIDTLQRIKEQGSDTYNYGGDYEMIAKLKEFTDETGICLLIVHHTRKQQADDKFDMISGTTGLFGAADGAFLLHKEKRVGVEAILEISGRDQMDQKIYLEKDRDTLKWEATKTEAEEVLSKPDPILEKVAEFTDTNIYWEGTPSELRSLLNIDLAPNKLTLHLNVNAGRLKNDYQVEYKSRRTHDGRRVSLCIDP